TAAPGNTVDLQFGDLGHSRGSNKPTVNRPFNDQGAAFFAALLQGAGTPPPPGRVTAFTQTCPSTVPDGGPFAANSFGDLATSQVKFGSAARQAVFAAGDPTTSAQFDPITTSDACKTI